MEQRQQHQPKRPVGRPPSAAVGVTLDAIMGNDEDD
jgi:hypothetical protein